MKRLATSFLCIFVLLLPTVASAVPIDISMESGGAEITAPDEMVLHNVLIGSDYYSLTFRWSPVRHIWYLTGSDLEAFTFRTSEYWPLEQGNTWTYSRSDGGILTLTVDGTEEICGVPALRLAASDGSSTYWINDDSGLYIVRYLFSDGVHNTWCPPAKIAPPQIYIGTQQLTPFYDVVMGYLGGPQFGSGDGWWSFVVKGLEDVTVPAGTFPDCARVTMVFDYKETWNNVDGYRIEEMWFAKDVGLVRRSTSNVAFKSGFLLQDSTAAYELLSSSLLP